MIVCLLLLAGCAKERMPKATGTLDIIHTMVDAGKIRPSFRDGSPALFRYTFDINYNLFSANNNRFGQYEGDTRLRLYAMPDTTEKDPPLMDLRLQLTEGSIQTLVLTGHKDQPDTMLIRDNIPWFNPKDSVMAFRFINCSPGSNPVNIRIKDGDIITEFSQMEYKQRSGFKTFPVLYNTRDYVFEAWDATTNVLLATYKTNGMDNGNQEAFRYRSYTMYLGGVAGATGVNAPKLFVQFHYQGQ